MPSSIKVRMRRAVEKSPDSMVAWYLLACWAYYEDNDPFLSDNEFHAFAKELRSEWDGLEHPHHETVLLYEDVKANTFMGEFPTIVGEAMKQLRQESK